MLFQTPTTAIGPHPTVLILGCKSARVVAAVEIESQDTYGLHQPGFKRQMPGEETYVLVTRHHIQTVKWFFGLVRRPRFCRFRSSLPQRRFEVGFRGHRSPAFR